MKLYATVTSERASKGQGGNESIRAEITIEREKVAEFHLVKYGEYGYRLHYFMNGEVGWKDITKGNKQKDEVCSFVECENISGMHYYDGLPVCDRHAYEINTH